MVKTKTVDEKIDELAQAVKVGFDGVYASMAQMKDELRTEMRKGFDSVKIELRAEMFDMKNELRAEMRAGFALHDRKFNEVDARLDVLEAR